MHLAINVDIKTFLLEQINEVSLFSIGRGEKLLDFLIIKVMTFIMVNKMKIWYNR